MPRIVAHTCRVAERRTYQDRRPYAVPVSLADLTGPSHGTIELPLALAWTGRRRYDLDVPGDAVVLYERVIVEAGNTVDLETILNGEILTRLWATLYLPIGVRNRWQSRFPTLSAAA
jgi:hypothetical protein